MSQCEEVKEIFRVAHVFLEYYHLVVIQVTITRGTKLLLLAYPQQGLVNRACSEHIAAQSGIIMKRTMSLMVKLKTRLLEPTPSYG